MFNIGQLVRSSDDARRLFQPIQDWAELSESGEIARELDEVLRTWDKPEFLCRYRRALQLIGKLDRIWTAANCVDMMELGERRVLLYALFTAIARHGNREVAAPSES